MDSLIKSIRMVTFKPNSLTNSRIILLLLVAAAGGLPASLSLEYAHYSRVLSMALFGLLLLLLSAGLLPRWRRSLLLFIGAPLLGFLFNGYRILALVDSQLPVEMEGKDVALVVSVKSLPQITRVKGRLSSIAFYARVISVAEDAVLPLQDKLIRLSWYHPSQKLNIRPGQRWALTARLKRPRGTVNPDGFDYQQWLLAKGVVATGYVRAKEPVEQIFEGYAGFDGWRYQLAQLISSASLMGEHGSLLAALMIGDKSAITQSQWQVLQKTGTIHLMAISGLHIGLAAGMGYWLGVLLSHLGALRRNQGMRWLPPVLAIIFASVYAGLAGFSIPTQRALVMIVVFSLALAMGRRLNYWYVFFVAVIGVEVLDPFAFLAPGFWLSFAAVAVLVSVFGWRKGVDGILLKTLKAQLWLLVGLAIPLAVLGLPVSLVSPIANLIAVPVVSLAIVPLLLLGAILSPFFGSATQVLLKLSAYIFEWLWPLLDFFASTDLHAYLGLGLEGIQLITLALMLGLFLAPAALKLRLLGVALLVVTVAPNERRDGRTQLTVMDVQQGLGVVIETPSETWVYDTGARYGEQFDMGSRVIAPFLRSRNVRQLDALVVSHGDNDHAGGFDALAREFQPKSVLAGEPDRLTGAVQACEAGQGWSAGGVSAEVLWPVAGYVSEKANNRSCVLLLTFNGQTVLLMGDVEKQVEQALLSSNVLPSGVDVLIVGHHGSKTSSSPALVAKLQPKYAVFSVGYKNRYHHPNKKVVERFERAGSRILRTDAHGAIAFFWGAEGLKLTQYRSAEPKPWFW